MPILKPNLAAMQAKRDTAGLVQLLKSKACHTRVEAVHALAEIGDPKSIPAIAELLLAAANPLEQVEIAEGLGKIASADAIEPLVKTIALSRERERVTIDAAIASPDRQYHEGLYINRISAEEYTLRSAIAAALAQIGGTRALQSLIEMLATETGQMADSVKRAVKESIVALLKRADAQFIPLLCDYLNHSSADVRQWAAYCLGEFGNAEATDELGKVAWDAHEEFGVREAAAVSLGCVGDLRALPYLEELMRQDNKFLASRAKHSLEMIRARVT